MKIGSMAGMLAVALALLGPAARAQEATKVPEGIAPYKATAGISGSLGSVGSDTMNNLMTLWQEGFKKLYPSVTIQVEGKGSSTAPPALIEGTAQLGPMSREMKPDEIDAFEKKFGYKPSCIRTSLDALAVWVNRDNPVQGLTLGQLDAIFSSTRRGGALQDITAWGQLGLTGDWDRPISLYGRNSASGTYGYFKDHALAKGDFKNTVKEQPGSASVVQGVENDRYAIGYSGIGYSTAGVRSVPIAKKDGGPFVSADVEHVLNGTYPLGRYLYIYFNKAPNRPLDPLTKEFLTFVLSKEGQEVVIKDGFLPLPKKVLDEERVNLQ
jgi:phosphate transport system substrate-binding protein